MSFQTVPSSSSTWSYYLGLRTITFHLAFMKNLLVFVSLGFHLINLHRQESLVSFLFSSTIHTVLFSPSLINFLLLEFSGVWPLLLSLVLTRIHLWCQLHYLLFADSLGTNQMRPLCLIYYLVHIFWYTNN